METKHTPLPYRGGKFSSVVGCPIVNDKGRRVCNTALPLIPNDHPFYEAWKEDAEANAEFIVRACNSHYELLDALKNIYYAVENHEGELAETVALLTKAAIAKAQGDANA